MNNSDWSSITTLASWNGKYFFNGTKIPVLVIASLIAMKKQSGRLQDLADVEALEKIQQ